MDTPVPCEYVFVAIEEWVKDEDTSLLIVGVFRTQERAQAALDARGPAEEEDGNAFFQRYVEERELDNARPIAHR